MSNQADKSMADLKEITGQLLVIVCAAQQIPPGPSHFTLATQASELVAKAVRDHGDSTCLPRLVLSCSRELIQTRNCSPQEALNWQIIGHDDPRLMQHSWRSKALAWQALGDHLFDLAHEVNGGDTDNAPSPSMSVDGDALEKGKGKVREVEPEKEKEREKPKDEQEKLHRKWPFSRMSKPVPKSAMKMPKRGKSGQEQKLRESVDSLDKEEEDRSSKPRSDTPSVIVTWRVSPAQPSRPSGPPQSPGSPKKAPFSPGMTPPLMRPDIPESSQATSESLRDVPPVVDAGAILIPRLNNPCRCCMQYELLCTTRFNKWKGTALMSCVLCTTKKVKCISARLGTLAATTQGQSTERTRASSTGPLTSQLTVWTRSQSWGPSVALSEPRGNPPKPWSWGQSKPSGSATMPIPPAAVIASSSSAATHAVQDLPIPDLHWMSMAIRKSANRIAALEACASEQESTIDMLRRLHESLRHSPPATPLSLLLDQAAPGLQSHVHLAPLPLIDFSTDSTGEEASTIVAPVMEPTILPSQTEAALDPATAIASMVPIKAVHSPADDGVSTFASAFALPGPPAMHPNPLETPKDGPSTTEIVEHGSPLNLLPEYDSGDEQDAVMQIIVEYSTISTAYPPLCKPLSPAHYLILGDRSAIPNPRYPVLSSWYLTLVLSCQPSVLDPQYSILGAWVTIPNPRYSVSVLDPWDLILTPRFAIPDPQYLVFGTWYSIGHTWYSWFAILYPRYLVLQYLILAAQFAIPDPQYSGLGTRYSVCHTRYSFI
ncbi:uncharacterized protein EDB91DRAFT_1088137 [Suillus paluster]|uniref:uncharacterized protein n=1 Tax=Suillus paluster TaxID=48578 RepID=UPI001B874519|nr:uncharacterized protein EDB91DRAFT_1088137 [Suillus paluster]KAG1722448.1 hypothetical protein EDB91DRAFT_1088137 [Suillus paluster]